MHGLACVMHECMFWGPCRSAITAVEPDCAACLHVLSLFSSGESCDQDSERAGRPVRGAVAFLMYGELHYYAFVQNAIEDREFCFSMSRAGICDVCRVIKSNSASMFPSNVAHTVLCCFAPYRQFDIVLFCAVLCCSALICSVLFRTSSTTRNRPASHRPSEITTSDVLYVKFSEIATPDVEHFEFCIFVWM